MDEEAGRPGSSREGGSRNVILDLSLSIEDQEDSSTIDCGNELALSSFPNFNELRRTGHLCDVEIECNGCKFLAHRAVLAATIPFFHVMFTSDMREAQSDRIQLSNIEAETLENILNFVYSGKIRICSKNLEKLLSAADYFQLSIISERCAELLSSRIAPTNALGIRRFAHFHNSSQAAIMADRFIKKHFVAVSMAEEFIVLDFNSLFQLLQEDDLHVDSEEQVFETVMRWIEADLEARRPLAARLLSAVRMPLLKPSFLMDLANNPIIHNSIECRDLVDEAKNFHLLPERRASFNSFKTSVRHCSDVPGIIYAVGGLNNVNIRRSNHTSSSVEIFDPLVGRWAPAKAMATLRTRVGVCAAEKRLYVIGGYNGVERLQCVEVYDPALNAWSFAPALLQKRSAMCVVTIPGHIYVCGGYDGIAALSTVESFNLATERWTIRAPMLSNRCAAAAVSLDGMIYVMGGHNGVTIFNTMERHDPATGTWERMPSMLSARCRLSSTVYAGKIYVVGGYNASVFLNTCEVFDPQRNEWEELQSMNLRRARVQLVTNGPLLYAIGGYDGENNLQSMEVFDPSTGTWQLGPNMIAHEGGVGAAVVPTAIDKTYTTKCKRERGGRDVQPLPSPQ